jgi:arylsulfatase
MRKLLLLAGLLLCSMQGTASDKPNVVIILLDNTGWADFGPWGGGDLRGAPSPNIDALAGQGLTLTNFNTEPQCTPSRSALMTGRFAIRSGNQSVPVGVPYYGLVPWELTMAELLKTRGYDTAIFGKWHLGKTPGRLPTDQGFDQWYGIPDSSDDSVRYSDWLKHYSTQQDMLDSLPPQERPYIYSGQSGQAPKEVKPFDLDAKRNIDGELTGMAVRYITEHADSDAPFLLYLPLTAMHYPTLPGEAFSGASGHGIYTDLLMQTDHYVGRVAEAIDAAGIGEETLLIFTADNGPEDPANGDNQYTGWTGPWRGTYFTALEGGLRTPFIARWQGRIAAGGRSNDIVHLVDIFSTVLEAAGVEPPTDRLIDGQSMLGFFTGETDRSPREGFPIFVGDELYAVKWRDWKTHFVFQDSKYSPKQEYSTVPMVNNLVQDPRETRQVAEPLNTWLQYPGMGVLIGYQRSLQIQPNIPVGAPDDYAPPSPRR